MKRDDFFKRFQLRLLRPHEYGAWRTFLNERCPDLFNSGPANMLTEADQRDLFRGSDHPIFVAVHRESGRFVGSAEIVFWIASTRGRKAHIENVAVDPNFRGNGIGRRLLRILLQLAVCRNAVKLELVSEPRRKAARHLYESHGFKLTEGSDRHYTWSKLGLAKRLGKCSD